ncbi:MAG TPA: tetratricopeptide repeat protein [Candidatus Dormibacteraeota bacterium]|nr:tetratricopeptide repeat protein [Candidatus Dormibacteraeota bacterium]
MAYNKTKHLAAAQKYLLQGKLPQAISEYTQILKQEPRDQVTLMTLGDLYVRQGETFQALEYFERLAKIFLSDGFTTKAIAIYKKIAKLAPEETRPLERLAELYVQQGVLSEARPIYLQLAEAHLKAGRQPQAAALLRKLLEAEPDNLRVQTRLAELQLSMGQQKEAIEVFCGAMEHVLDHGDHAEAIRLAERILQLNPAHQPTLLLKARALSAAGSKQEAANLLEALPDLDAGGESTTLLLEIYQDNGQSEKAMALAEKIFARDAKKYQVAHRLANQLLEAGDLDRARSLIALIRDAAIDSGDHETMAQTISRMAECRPGEVEPLGWLVDLYGRASDSFRLPDALAQLAQAQEAAGNPEQALATYERLLERTPEDETTRRKFVRLRAQSGLEPLAEESSPPVKVDPDAAGESAPQTSASAEPMLEEETQRYVTQALTDVDLFSSYGLTQKAIDLLESVLERTPRHGPVLERLLDLSVGAGNDRRTAEIALILEQIARERQDPSAAERYAELRRRFQRAAGIEPNQESSPNAAPQEFAVPIIEAELDEPVVETPSGETPLVSMGIPMPIESVVHEVDLSDEWAALSQQLEDAVQVEGLAAPLEDDAALQTSTPDTEAEATSEAPLQVGEENTGEASPEVPAEVPDETPAFELEIQDDMPATAGGETQAADIFFEEIAADLESAATSLGIPTPVVRAATPEAAGPEPPANASEEHSGSTGESSAVSEPVEPAEPGGPLSDLFDEFRSDLGEFNKEDEDLETHYNLGIAYREMGLLEEAISEFQKVAHFSGKGPAFRYAMQCSTLLGLAFMEKGQPAIAAIWYERALKIPGLDQESILALRYDLGVAQELAGDQAAAFNSFSQVYAMNIDYRDVSERIALLGKAR